MLIQDSAVILAFIVVSHTFILIFPQNIINLNTFFQLVIVGTWSDCDVAQKKKPKVSYTPVVFSR